MLNLPLIFIFTGLFSPDTMRLHLALISEAYLFRRFAISYLITMFYLIDALYRITNFIFGSAQLSSSHKFYSYSMILSSSHFTLNCLPHFTPHLIGFVLALIQSVLFCSALLCSALFCSDIFHLQH